jgi:hypothetical protein
MVGVVSAIAQAIWVTRPYEAIVNLGVRRFRLRGTPGKQWDKQLREAKARVLFYGKDHNELIKHKYDILKRLLVENDVHIQFYLLAADDAYYKEPQGIVELPERLEAAKKLFDLKRKVALEKPTAASQLVLKQYRGRPTFTCTRVDQLIIFGPYVPNMDNKGIPEFEIQPATEMWLHERCEEAFDAAVRDSADLAEPTNAEITAAAAAAVAAAAAEVAAAAGAVPTTTSSGGH